MFEYIEFIGIIAFTIMGFLVAVENELDILGAFLISFTTALGGGIIRDITINEIPYSFQNVLPVSIVVITFLFISFLYFKREIKIQKNSKMMIFFDSIGLVSFSISGALVALKVEFNFMGIILLSIITALGGGIIRDMMLNKIPIILKGDFYGSISLLIALLTIGLNEMQILNTYLVSMMLLFGVLLRMYVYIKGIELPHLRGKI